jgi:hypothetical protein
VTLRHRAGDASAEADGAPSSAPDPRDDRERRRRRLAIRCAALAPWGTAAAWVLWRNAPDGAFELPAFGESLVVVGLCVALSALCFIGATSVGGAEPAGIAAAILRGATFGAASVSVLAAVGAGVPGVESATLSLWMGLAWLLLAVGECKLAALHYSLTCFVVGLALFCAASLPAAAACFAWLRTTRAPTPPAPPRAKVRVGRDVAAAQCVGAAAVIFGVLALTRAAGVLRELWSFEGCALAAGLPAWFGLRRAVPSRSVAS